MLTVTVVPIITIFLITLLSVSDTNRFPRLSEVIPMGLLNFAVCRPFPSIYPWDDPAIVDTVFANKSTLRIRLLPLSVTYSTLP